VSDLLPACQSAAWSTMPACGEQERRGLCLSWQGGLRRVRLRDGRACPGHPVLAPPAKRTRPDWRAAGVCAYRAHHPGVGGFGGRVARAAGAVAPSRARGCRVWRASGPATSWCVPSTLSLSLSLLPGASPGRPSATQPSAAVVKALKATTGAAGSAGTAGSRGDWQAGDSAQVPSAGGGGEAHRWSPRSSSELQHLAADFVASSAGASSAASSSIASSLSGSERQGLVFRSSRPLYQTDPLIRCAAARARAPQPRPCCVQPAIAPARQN